MNTYIIQHTRISSVTELVISKVTAETPTEALNLATRDQAIEIETHQESSTPIATHSYEIINEEVPTNG